MWREAGEAAWRRRKVQVRTAGAHGSSVLCAVCCVLCALTPCTAAHQEAKERAEPDRMGR